MSGPASVEILGLTDVGKTRDHNEDTIGWQANLGLAVLADGMGGHNAGEVASEIAVNTIVDHISAFADDGTLDNNVITSCQNAVLAANAAIHESAQQDAAHAGMGTTIVLACFRDGQVTIAHVGDSRLYRYRQGQMQQLTADHSLVQEMVRGGYMTEEEAMISTNKNMITRALGIDPKVIVDVQQQAVSASDVYLLCSDGLSDLVTGTEMEEILGAHGGDLTQAAQALVQAANNHGGLDNISVILVKII